VGLPAIAIQYAELLPPVGCSFAGRGVLSGGDGMNSRVKRIAAGLVFFLALMALYGFAGSDELDSLSAEQRADVVARWGE
jgi:hypothetical protein